MASEPQQETNSNYDARFPYAVLRQAGNYLFILYQKATELFSHKKAEEPKPKYGRMPEIFINTGSDGLEHVVIGNEEAFTMDPKKTRKEVIIPERIFKKVVKQIV